MVFQPWRFWSEVLLLISALAGCAVNPSFPVSIIEAETIWLEMSENPNALERPVVVLCGIFDPGRGGEGVADKLVEVASDNARIIVVEFTGVYDFDACARRVVETVERTWPSFDEEATVEVDVVGCSMGGLVARRAASEAAEPVKKLNIARLFTISTPHQGARLAFDHPTDSRIADMIQGSTFLSTIDSVPADYEIVPYVCLDDHVVGEEHAAPAGQVPWWVANQPFRSAHMGANNDVRILADIARRLRGEVPLTTSPPAPLPPERFGVRSIAWND